MPADGSHWQELRGSRARARTWADIAPGPCGKGFGEASGMVAEPCGQKRLNAGSLWLELLSEEARVFLTRAGLPFSTAVPYRSTFKEVSPRASHKNVIEKISQL